MTETTTKGFDRLFDLIGDPTVDFELVDGDPIVRAVNPAFEETFGYDRTRLRGKSLNEFIVPDGQVSEASAFDQRTEEGKQNTGLVTRETADGVREFFYRGVPYEEDGTRRGLAIYTDVTEQQRYERHARVVHRLLRHDLRNSVQIVMGAATDLAGHANTPEMTDRAETVIEHAERLLTVSTEASVIEQVLLENYECYPLDVSACVQSVVTKRRATHPAATLALSVPDRVTVVGVDWLEDAIDALVDNAVRYAGEEPTVSVAVEPTDEHVRVTVTDDGPGIPPDFRGPVFEDADITDIQHNRGLGLWLVRWVVDACGGHIEYDRTNGETTVSLVLQRPSTD